MKNLTKINNIYINLDAFAGFEFSDEDMCVWAYDQNFDYQSFYIENESEYNALKNYIDSLVFKPVAPSRVRASTPFKSPAPFKMKIK